MHNAFCNYTSFSVPYVMVAIVCIIHGYRKDTHMYKYYGLEVSIRLSNYKRVSLTT